MRIFRSIIISASCFLLLSFLVPPAFAQVTLLPKADDYIDCDFMLNEYEISGEFPTEGERTAHEAQKSADNYTDLSDAYAKKSADVKAKDDVCNNFDNAEGCSENDKAKESLAKDQQAIDEAKQQMEADQSFANANADNGFKDRDNLLGCAIKTGRISFQMAPYFITYVSDFVLSLIGLVCVLFIVLGGYYYIYGGLTDQKEKGKKTIEHALMGMAVAILAWVIVGAIMSIVTGA